MSNTVRNVLLGGVVVLLAVNAYFLWQGNDDQPKVKKVVESGTENPGKAEKTAQNGIISPDNKLDKSKTNDFDPLASQKENQVASGPKTVMTFDEYVHDFGKVMQDSENSYTFKFTNTGSEPLVIEKAKGSCGCTVPTYPKEPIPPGGIGEIGVVYKPGKQKNNQTKKVTITANTDPVQTILTIKANVEEIAS